MNSLSWMTSWPLKLWISQRCLECGLGMIPRESSTSWQCTSNRHPSTVLICQFRIRFWLPRRSSNKGKTSLLNTSCTKCANQQLEPKGCWRGALIIDILFLFKTFPKKMFQPTMDSIPEIYVDPTLPPIPIIKHGYENMCKLHHKQKLLFCKFCETNEVCYSLLHFSHSIFSLSCNDVLQRSTIKAWIVVSTYIYMYIVIFWSISFFFVQISPPLPPRTSKQPPPLPEKLHNKPPLPDKLHKLPPHLQPRKH